MKRALAISLAAAIALSLLAAPSAVAGKKKKKKKPVTITFEESGSMTLPGPTGLALFGISEAEFTQVHTCSALPTSQGLDGWVVEIPEDFRLGTASLEVTGTDATGSHDLDVYFYDSGCGLMVDNSLTGGPNESGMIPGGAQWAVVDLIVGANATFELKGTATVTS